MAPKNGWLQKIQISNKIKKNIVEKHYLVKIGEKIDNYRIGVTFLTFYNPTYGEDNPHPYEVFILKCKDDWFLVSFYQEDYDGDEYHGGYEEYYECDGFECLLDLLKKEAKLG